MLLMIVGLALFAGIHLIPSLAPGLKTSWRDRMGEGGYKGTFSLLLLAGLVCIVLGWRSTIPSGLYAPPAALHGVALGALYIAFLLMVTSSRNSRLLQWIRHPQLTGVTVWALAHLSLNGDNRSVLLFSTLGIWALVEMILINRREGAWVKAEVPPLSTDLINLVIALVVVAVVLFLHPWFAGVPVR